MNLNINKWTFNGYADFAVLTSFQCIYIQVLHVFNNIHFLEFMMYLCRRGRENLRLKGGYLTFVYFYIKVHLY